MTLIMDAEKLLNNDKKVNIALFLIHAVTFFY